MGKYKKYEIFYLLFVGTVFLAVLNVLPAKSRGKDDAQVLSQQGQIQNAAQVQGQVKQPEAASPAAAAETDDPGKPKAQVKTQPQAKPAPAPQAARETAATLIPGGNLPGETPDPVTLKIASINLTAPIVKTGLEEDGSLHVPSSADLTGWYSLGPKPGEPGPSVITGHYDSKAGPGILYNLKKTKAGDEIDIVRNDGSVAVFVIDKEELYLQDEFATQAVYGFTSKSSLRIITCAGTYDKKTGHYSHDLVVYATLKEIRTPGKYQPL